VHPWLLCWGALKCGRLFDADCRTIPPFQTHSLSLTPSSKRGRLLPFANLLTTYSDPTLVAAPHFMSLFEIRKWFSCQEFKCESTPRCHRNEFTYRNMNVYTLYNFYLPRYSNVDLFYPSPIWDVSLNFRNETQLHGDQKSPTFLEIPSHNRNENACPVSDQI
jgi:hypothetical protein